MKIKKKMFFFFFLFSVSFFLVGCFEANESGALEAEAVEEVEDTEINVESSNVERSSSREVVIENMRFNPTDISVSVGDTVEWVNLDSVDHTVSFEDSRFDVEIPAGASVSYTFSELGEARYFCSFHPGMQGSVLVE